MLDSPAQVTTAEQKRYLAFAAVLFTQNGHFCEELEIEDKEKAKTILRKWWGITDHSEAAKTAESLSVAAAHTPFADDAYREFIIKGRLFPSAKEELQDLTGLGNAYRSSVKRVLYNAGAKDEEMTPEHIEELAAQDEGAEAFLEELFNRLSAGLECYEQAKGILVRAGVTGEEMAGIGSLSAWDYGRTGIIARYGYNAGYLSREEAWHFMETAAGNASGAYSCWREYFAAYILGRAIAFGADCKDQYQTMNYLLNNEYESPVFNVPFK